jgi:hypothetical protein
MRHEIIIAEMSSGNVRRISRHSVTTAAGAARLLRSGCQLWMAEQTARALGATIETNWGRLPDGTEIRIKSPELMARA